MKASGILEFQFENEKIALAIYSSLKPDNLLVKENMNISENIREKELKIVVRIRDNKASIVDALRSTLDEILMHIKSVEETIKILAKDAKKS